MTRAFSCTALTTLFVLVVASCESDSMHLSPGPSGAVAAMVDPSGDVTPHAGVSPTRYTNSGPFTATWVVSNTSPYPVCSFEFISATGVSVIDHNPFHDPTVVQSGHAYQASYTYYTTSYTGLADIQLAVFLDYGYGDCDPDLETYLGEAHIQVPVVAPTYGVDISGPTMMRPNVVCTWTATAHDGTPPYTYDWTEYNYGGTFSQTTSGASSAQFGGGDTGVSIGVTVTDASNNQVSGSTWAQVDEGLGSNCP